MELATFSMLIDVDQSYKLLDRVFRAITELSNDYPTFKVVQIIPTPCFTSALLVYEKKAV